MSNMKEVFEAIRKDKGRLKEEMIMQEAIASAELAGASIKKPKKII